jgi:hypothetical protein
MALVIKKSKANSGLVFAVSTLETSVDAPLNARRIFRIGTARSRVLTSVRPLMRRHVSRARMGVRGSDPYQIGALDALCLKLVFRSRLIDCCAIPSVRPSTFSTTSG